MGLSFLLFQPVRRALAPWYAKQIDSALDMQDELRLDRLLIEAADSFELLVLVMLAGVWLGLLD